ncbi:MAG: formate dehydrogenase accessory sulfurtransferase FdhD [Chloroflexota bacterium]
MSAVEQVTCRRYLGDEWTEESTSVAREAAVVIYVNGQEMVTVLCTPVNINFLVLGFLYSEGIIESLKDIASMKVCDDELEVDVRLSRGDIELPQARTLTSGCGGGMTLTDRNTKKLRISSNLVVPSSQVTSLMKRLLNAADTHREHGGLHASALGQGDELLVVAEDIGRHNTLDKVLGECLLKGIPTRDRVLLSTGRVSSEMLLKAGRMATPIVISRGAITGRAISLAGELGITAIGYARGERFTVYTHPERVESKADNLAYCQRR